ncbi:DUF1684 domain-containing protein [soil metagenome]
MPRPIRLLLLAGLAIIMFYFIGEAFTGEEQYIATVEGSRQEKDRSFRLASDSPLPAEEKAVFTGLKYYPVDPQYRVEATFEPVARPDTVWLTMTKGESEAYLRHARGIFELEGRQQTLMLFLRAGDQERELFVPFTDKTNGFETYGGGRYLDVPLPQPGSATITLDFNRAYSPFCAFDDAFACPVPPAENRLQVPIPAGEKAFHD